MNTTLTRRQFLAASGAAVALTAAGPHLIAADAPKRSIKKAVMWATVGYPGTVLEKMKAIKAAGFDGVEMMSHMTVEEVLKARDEVGLQIPSVCGGLHW